MSKFLLRQDSEQCEHELLPPLWLYTDNNDAGSKFAEVCHNSEKGVGNCTTYVLFRVSLRAKYGDELEKGKLGGMDSSHRLCDAEVIVVGSDD